MSEKKVALWGSFDFLRIGHIKFLKEASGYGDLYVIAVPDRIIKENKGPFRPIFCEEERIKALEKLDFVKKIYVDCFEDGMKSLSEIRPDFFCFGTKQDKKIKDQLIELIRRKYKKTKIIEIEEDFETRRSKDFVELSSHNKEILKKNQAKILKHYQKYSRT